MPVQNEGEGKGRSLSNHEFHCWAIFVLDRAAVPPPPSQKSELFSVKPTKRNLSKMTKPRQSSDISQSVLTIHYLPPLVRCPWRDSPRRFASLFETPASRMSLLR